MGLRSGSLAVASAVALGSFALTAGPAAADTVHTRTDTFEDCQVHSRLALLYSGDIEVRTSLEGTDPNCDRSIVRARVTYVEADGDPREVVAEGVHAVRQTFAAAGATDVASFHSTDYEFCDIERPETCHSPEYRLPK